MYVFYIRAELRGIWTIWKIMCCFYCSYRSFYLFISPSVYLRFINFVYSWGIFAHSTSRIKTVSYMKMWVTHGPVFQPEMIYATASGCTLYFSRRWLVSYSVLRARASEWEIPSELKNATRNIVFDENGTPRSLNWDFTPRACVHAFAFFRRSTRESTLLGPSFTELEYAQSIISVSRGSKPSAYNVHDVFVKQKNAKFSYPHRNGERKRVWAERRNVEERCGERSRGEIPRTHRVGSMPASAMIILFSMEIIGI